MAEMPSVSLASGPNLPPRGEKELTVVVITRARSASEVAKWMTTRCELRPESTTSLPRKAWIAMTPTAPSAGQNSEATERYFTQAKTATAITSTMTMDAEARCEYSTMAWKVSGGYHLPWQRGQSGQPSPDPVPRTVPPTPISTSVIAVVASDSFWNRFTRRGPPPEAPLKAPDHIEARLSGSDVEP